MEGIIRLTIERLPEAVYPGTSDDVQGRVVQGDTIAQVIEYAQDAARVLRETRVERGWDDPVPGEPAPEHIVMPVVLAA